MRINLLSLVILRNIVFMCIYIYTKKSIYTNMYIYINICIDKDVYRHIHSVCGVYLFDYKCVCDPVRLNRVVVCSLLYVYGCMCYVHILHVLFI